MKIRKNVQQKNLILNKDYYTPTDIREMLLNKEITYFNGVTEECYEPIALYELEDTILRIFTENLVELKVVVDDYGHYTNIAVGKNGKKYYVVL